MDSRFDKDTRTMGIWNWEEMANKEIFEKGSWRKPKFSKGCSAVKEVSKEGRNILIILWSTSSSRISENRKK